MQGSRQVSAGYDKALTADEVISGLMEKVKTQFETSGDIDAIFDRLEFDGDMIFDLTCEEYNRLYQKIKEALIIVSLIKACGVNIKVARYLLSK